MIERMKPTKFFIYVRKSTDETKRQVLSLDAQERELRDLVRKEKLTVCEIIEESHSAKAPGRPLFNRMLTRIENGEASGVIIWDIDRLYRNPADEGRVRWMLQRGIIECIRTPTRSYSPADAGILIAVEGGRATDFIIHHKRDVARGVHEKLLKGGWPGNSPLGYLHDRNLKNIIPDPTRSKVVLAIFESVSTGAHGLLWVSDRLAEHGIVSKGGNKWTKSQVHKLLTNQLYKGVMVWNGVTYEGKYRPIVSAELFDKVAKALRDRSKPRRGRKGHDFPLRGLFRCTCGSMITAQWAKGHGGLYRYYRCTRKAGACSEPYLSEGSLASQCAGLFRPVGITTDQANLLRKIVADEAASAARATEAERLKNAERLTIIQEQLNRLTSSYAREIIDEDGFKCATAELVNEKVALKHEKSRLQKTGSSYWIEPTNEFINTLEAAGKIDVSNSPQEISELMRKIGTNRLISRKTVSFNFSPPYDFTSAFLAETRVTSDSSPDAPKPLSGSSVLWCPGQDSNLHALRHTPLKRVCLPIPPPGQLGSEEGGLR